MEKFLLFMVKLFTAFTSLAFFMMAGWSFFTHMPLFLTFMGLLMGTIIGFFTYRDVTGFFKNK